MCIVATAPTKVTMVGSSALKLQAPGEFELGGVIVIVPASRAALINGKAPKFGAAAMAGVAKPKVAMAKASKKRFIP